MTSVREYADADSVVSELEFVDVCRRHDLRRSKHDFASSAYGIFAKAASAELFKIGRAHV